MDSTTVRRSLVGAVVGGVVFGGVSVYRSAVAGGPLLDYAGPVAMLFVVGATVGGLVGPLLGEAWARTRRRSPDVSSEDEAVPGRPPLLVTLSVGLLVGFGIGTAWGSVPAGLGLGLLMAVAAQRIFR